MKPIPALFLLAALPISLSLLASTQTSSLPGLRSNKVVLFRAIPYEVRPGGQAVLEGSGFSKGSNKVYFNGVEGFVATSTSGISLTITVPTSLPESRYKISVSNILGSSDNPQIPIYIKITNNPQPSPVIEKASISGEMVTVTGKNFTSLNTLITTLGNKEAVMSDGANISFRLSELPHYERVKKSLKNNKFQFSLWIFVQNEHGVNKNPYKLDTII